MIAIAIQTLFETRPPVFDLERSISFYRDILGLKLAHTISARHVAFFWIGSPGQAMLGLWSIPCSPLTMRLHIAFRVDMQQIESSISALRLAGLTQHSGAGNPIDEPIVHAWMPAASVYFEDPDGHSLEYLCMLPDAPRLDLDQVPLSQWRLLK